MSAWAVILAAGSGSRLAASIGVKKQFLAVAGKPLFWLAARSLARAPGLDGLVFVFPPDHPEAPDLTSRLDAAESLGLPFRCVVGGARRQDSVENGLAALPRSCQRVLVHDAARCLLPPAVTARVLDALADGHQAVIPALPVTDTIKRADGDMVATTLPRRTLRAVQTPQGFDLALLRQAFAFARTRDLDVTDDASLIEALGHPVFIVQGSETNIKITTPEDLRRLDMAHSPRSYPVTGHGYDVHRFAPEPPPDGAPARPMVLGGVRIPGAPMVLAHSDGDALIHALVDALLGCLGLSDIGALFPDTDPAYEAMPSGVFLSEVLTLCEKRGLTIHHADLTIITQIPRIGPHREHIRNSLAALLGLEPDRVALKATTEEGLGFTGEKRGIKAVALVTATRRVDDPDRTA